MDKLPSELIPNIIGRLTSVQDLRNARLACRAFGPCAESLMFRDLSIWIQKDCLERLVSISQAEHLRKHVQSLSIGPEFLIYGAMTEENFHQLLYLQDFQSSDQKPSLYPLELERMTPGFKTSAWRQYNHLAEEHESFLGSNAYEKHLAIALTNLPSLGIVTIRSGSMDEHPPSWGVMAMSKAILLCPYWSAMWGQESEVWHQLDILCRAAAQAEHTFEKVEFNIGKNLGYLGSGAAIFSETDIACARIAFNNVTSLRMDMPKGIRGLSSKDMIDMNIAQFISSMPSLEELDLSDVYQTEEIMTGLRTAPQFERLRSLRLSGFRCFANDLTMFVQKHAETLRELEVTHCAVPEECLESCFHNLDQGLMLEHTVITLIEDESDLGED